MHKCVVCSNSSARTKYTRPDVIYHTFPKNEYRRKKWLKIYGIDRCYDWHRICSDHFLEENYRPGGKRILKKNITPLPYDHNWDENGFPSNYTGMTLSNDGEMGNNEFLPTEQNHSSYTTQSSNVETSDNAFLPGEQNRLSYTTQSSNVETSDNAFLPGEQNRLREVQNAVINNFKSPRRSCRKIKLTTTYDDMSYEDMPRLQTERIERQVPTCIANENNQTIIDSVEVPVIPSDTPRDHTKGHGIRCSVKNCRNRYSKYLSFFGYPSDFALRKKWIEKCGLQVDPTLKVKSGARVCRFHFTDDCFMNTLRKNRLRPDAIPSLFLDDDIIDARNIPSTSSPASSRVIHVNKPSPVKSGPKRVNKRSPVNNAVIRDNKPSCSSSNYVANMESQQTALLVYIDSSTRSAKNFDGFCSIPGCITNTIEETEDINLFAPTIENVNQWSSSLGLNLTINSIVCERHFRPQDILHPNLLVNGENSKLKSLVPSALPVPTLNDVPESKMLCSIPDCLSNTLQEEEDISIFAPTIENVDRWSSSLHTKLTINSVLCERHFRPQDIILSNLLVNGSITEIRALKPSALPLPSMDAVPESKLYCAIPGCVTNFISEKEDISLFSPTIENVDRWSYALGLNLTLKSFVCERHFKSLDIINSNVLINGVTTSVKALELSSLPLRTVNTVTESKRLCSLPGCITNTIEEVEDISIFRPPIGSVREWSTILGLQLSRKSSVCQRHFRPQDVIDKTDYELGFYRRIQALVPFSKPVPINAGLSASNATPLIQQSETNNVPVLGTHPGQFKRHKPNEPLYTKSTKYNILDDESIAPNDKMFSSENENKEYTAVTNGALEYNSNSDLDPTSKSNIVQYVDLSIVKTEPLDEDDLQINLETETETEQILPTLKMGLVEDDDLQINLETEQILPTLKTGLVEDDELLPLSSIDDSLSTSLKKLKNFSANSSLSITLEPIENSKITEPSVDLFSKVSGKSSMSITLQPKPKVSTTINSYPSVSLTHSPSTSNSSMYNTSRQTLLHFNQEANSTLKIPDKMSSNTLIRPEFINNQIIFLKPIPPSNKSNSSELPELKTPVISKCISSAVNSNTHDYKPDHSTNIPEYIISDDDDDEDTKEFIEKDLGFIYAISKSVVLPSAYWRSVHDKSRNVTNFHQLDDYRKTVKTVIFYNSLLPNIYVYGKKYKYNKPVRTNNELQNLLEKLESVQKCLGYDGHHNNDCIGYYEKSSDDVTIWCSVCQKKFKNSQVMMESKTKSSERLVQKISEQTAQLEEFRKNMENNRKNPTPTELVTLRPTSLIDTMRVRRH